MMQLKITIKSELLLTLIEVTKSIPKNTCPNSSSMIFINLSYSYGLIKDCSAINEQINTLQTFFCTIIYFEYYLFALLAK